VQCDRLFEGADGDKSGEAAMRSGAAALGAVDRGGAKQVMLNHVAAQGSPLCENFTP
jgi:hypothetical protein